MLLMRAQFHDVGPSDGGFVVIPGSHRSHFPLPSNRLLSMVLRKRLLLPPFKMLKTESLPRQARDKHRKS